MPIMLWHDHQTIMRWQTTRHHVTQLSSHLFPYSLQLLYNLDSPHNSAVFSRAVGIYRRKSLSVTSHIRHGFVDARNAPRRSTSWVDCRHLMTRDPKRVAAFAEANGSRLSSRSTSPLSHFPHLLPAGHLDLAILSHMLSSALVHALGERATMLSPTHVNLSFFKRERPTLELFACGLLFWLLLPKKSKVLTRLSSTVVQNGCEKMLNLKLWKILIILE